MPRQILILLALPALALAVPSIFEPVADGVYVVRDDMGAWSGDLSFGITHQCAAPYQAKKILDLTNVPQDVWDAAKSVRLSVLLMVRDYSGHLIQVANGLDESFEIVANGTVHTYPTNCGAPVYDEAGRQTADWFDFDLPKSEFTKGVNEVVIRKAQSDKNDDYVYLCIDQTESRGNSAVNFDGDRWRTDVLTIPGGKGEYLVRLYLLTKELSVQGTWKPGQPLDDPAGLVLYAGAQGAQAGADGLALGPGQTARIECRPKALDALQAITADLAGTGAVQVSWLDATGKPVSPATVTPPSQVICPPAQAATVTGLELKATDQPATIASVSLRGALSVHPQAKPVDMCPKIAATAGRPEQIEPTCLSQDGKFTLETTGLRAVFESGDRLRLTSLHNGYTDCEMVRDPAQVFLFLIEVGEKRYAGSRDFLCKRVTPDGKAGFVADLELPDPALKATLTVRMESEGLRMGMTIANAGQAPADFKLAFPHLAGLTPSGDPASDYYYFPWGGGIIADRAASIRRGYGDHEALYQVMDLFSPQRGGGLYVRADDTEGWHKTLALRKCVAGTSDESFERAISPVRPEYRWTSPLERVQGTGLAYEYLRLTREAGKEFRPADAVLAAHPGDWHVAMRAYADWAHHVWKFRPYPSRLRNVHQMIARGWADDILFKGGSYRTDLVQDNTDCVELMSWWDWANHGPYNTPFDKLSPGQMKEWQPYFVKDPVTGETMWNNQPGDYAGYNERFGGLPAFRNCVKECQMRGALTTLYTDPFRLDGSCKVGAEHGAEWTVVDMDGKPSQGYDVWNPCHDIPEVRQWVADTMRRGIKETGADGIRLDEYGHRGWACYSKEHKHTFAEYGVTQWLKETAETVKMVRQAMDEVAPGSVLTTEHPGYDYLMQYMDGCITYDMTVQAMPLRPLECNAQRFFFRECKPFELDHMGADLESKKKIWNGEDSFGRYFPPTMYALLKENEDVYQDGEAEPLVPTLRQFVYANRFSGAGKTMLHLYNAAGHTLEAPVIAVPLHDGQHVFDMLELKECPVQDSPQGKVLTRYMPRDAVACIAVLPKALSVTRDGAKLVVATSVPTQGCRLVVCGADSKELVSYVLIGARTEVSVPPGKAPVCVKLLKGRDLVDVAEVR